MLRVHNINWNLYREVETGEVFFLIIVFDQWLEQETQTQLAGPGKEQMSEDM